MYKRKDGLYAQGVRIDGKIRFFYGKTEKEVRRKMLEYNKEQEHGKTFKHCAEAWQGEKMEETTQGTTVAYRAPVKRLVGEFGNKYVNEITPAELKAFLNKMKAQGFKYGTIDQHISVLRMIFDYAINEKGSTLRYNPATSLKVPAGLKQSRRNPPTPEQLQLIKPDSDMGLFAYFLIYTGLRRGELLGLRYEDIDRENKVIHVTKELCYADSTKGFIKPPKSESGVRDVDLLDVLAAVLPDKKTGYLFGGSQPLTKSQFQKAWLDYCKSIGQAEQRTYMKKDHNGKSYPQKVWQPLLTPHEFRHEYASMLEDAGITEFDAMSLLGHSSITVTKNVYTHIREDKNKRTGSALNDYVQSKNNC